MRSKIVDLSIIVPAYNEEQRIGKTLRNIEAFFEAKNLNFEILVVDDGSKDKTQEMISSLKIKQVRILSYGRNRGKGFAVNYGAKNALGSWILFTDADNSTPIEEFDKLWAFRNEFPIIIGSRYVKGSKIARRQGVPRIVLSRFGNLLVQALILPGINDTQCGFKLFSAISAKAIFNLQTIWRWGFDMEILRIASEHHFKIKEVPITWFNDEQSRLQSSSVFTSTLLELMIIKINSIRGLYRIGGKSEFAYFWRFTVVGLVGTLLDFFVLYLAHDVLGINLYYALTLGFLTGALNNYFMNSYWSFQTTLSTKKLGQFLSVALVGLATNYLLVYILTGQFNWEYKLSKLIAVVVVFAWNYFGNRYWTFRSSLVTDTQHSTRDR